MPYIESVCVAGRTIEVERYYTARYGKRGQHRSGRRKPTGEEQKEINNRHAEKKLRRLLNANFGPGDFHLVLSYKRGREDPFRSGEEMREDVRKFMRGLRRDLKRTGTELKYIHVPEVGPKGARHHHIVLNKIDTELIRKNWPHGFIHVNPLDDSGDYRKLAAYLIKYSGQTVGTGDAIQGKRWNSSRNLIHPEPVKKVITKRDWFRSVAKVPHKYRDRYEIDKSTIESGNISAEYGGYGFFRFTMRLRC